jgi:RNA polymerase sigma-70 factor, ECF subfamily
MNESALQPPSFTASEIDPIAFEEIVRRYERPMRQFAFRLLGSTHAMEDALQEACLKAFRALPSFRPHSEAALRAWLFRIVYHACIDELRRQSRAPLLAVDVEASADEPSRDPIEEVDERRRLASALAELPLELRAPLLVVDLLGFDYESAGRLLNVPPGTIGSRLNRARTTLRRSLTSPVAISEDSRDA